MRTINLYAEFDILTDYWFIAVLVVIVLLGIAILILFNKLSALSARVEKHKNNSSSKNFTTQAESNAATDMLTRLRKLEEKSNARPDTSHEIVNAPVEAPKPVAEIERPYEVELSVQKPKSIEFYMPTPNPDGSFEVSQSSEVFRQTISLYKFTADPKDPATASFTFFSDDIGVNDAINNPKRYLEPVCYEENDAFTGAKRIIVQKPGTAIKTGDKWIVDKNNKLKIKYQ